MPALTAYLSYLFFEIILDKQSIKRHSLDEKLTLKIRDSYSFTFN